MSEGRAARVQGIQGIRDTGSQGVQGAGRQGTRAILMPG